MGSLEGELVAAKAVKCMMSDCSVSHNLGPWSLEELPRYSPQEVGTVPGVASQDGVKFSRCARETFLSSP